ncbi:MAG TPA: hypothetical protein VFJ02_08795 [Vicinamibacterales bacterium]|nr:hypothetical protein [Vicinamibacterales bacterium]
MIERVAFGILLVLASALVYVPAVRAALSRPTALPAMHALFAASRLAGWLGAYVVLGNLARYSDLLTFYLPEARLAMQGQVPYRDFPSSYGPLFPYLAGALLPLWPSPAAVALAMIAFEVMAVLLFARILRRNGVGDQIITGMLFVYTLSPGALYWSGMIGYNSSVVLFFWVAAAGWLIAGRYGRSLVALAGSVVCGKVLGLLVAPIWIVHPRRRHLQIAAAAVAAGLLAFAAQQLGLDVLLPMQREGNRSTSGNVWFLLSGVLPFSTGGPLWRFGPILALGGAVAVLALLCYLRWRDEVSPERLAAAIAATGWLFVLLSKKSYPHYVPMFLLFAVFAMTSRHGVSGRWVGLLALFGAVGIIEPGIWNAVGQPPFLTSDMGRGTPADWRLLIVLDVVLIGLSAYFCALAWRIATTPAAMARAVRV